MHPMPSGLHRQRYRPYYSYTAVVKEYQRRFLEHFHRIDCRELLRAQDLEPSELALELAGGDHCGRLIVTAAELLTDMLEEA